jgi:hypothetical protein
MVNYIVGGRKMVLSFILKKILGLELRQPDDQGLYDQIASIERMKLYASIGSSHYHSRFSSMCDRESRPAVPSYTIFRREEQDPIAVLFRNRSYR